MYIKFELKIKFLACLLLVAYGLWVAVTPANAATGIFKQINFQGKVVNTDGTNVTNSSYNFVFCLYTTASPATPCTAGANNDAVWRESKSITVTDGIFQTSLGDTTSLPGSVDFNSDNIYLGVNFNSNGQMSPLVRFTAVPYAFNADKIHGLTVTDTTGTFTLTNAKTLAVNNSLTFAGTDGTTLTFQGTDTYVGRTTTDTLTNKTIGSTGLIFSGAATDITTATNEGLTFTAGGNGDFVFTTDADTTFAVSNLANCDTLDTDVNGVLSCGTDAGGAGGAGTLQESYDTGAAGDQVLGLDSTQDSIIIRNPSSAGSDSAFTLKIEQLNTGIANNALYVDNRGTGGGLRIDDESGDTSPFIVDENGRVGVGTTTVEGSTERLLQVGSPTNRGNTVSYGEVVTKGLKDIQALTNIKDVYVYDTTADSDGGRWIDWSTTEKLSWYTESLDDAPSDPCNIASDDRCYTSHFPRKAILVVTTDALYIFDAATNDMWMKFSQNASGYALGVDTNNDPSSVTALNGVIYVGTNGSSAGGLYSFDFTQDRMWNYDTTDRSGADVGIGSRNSAVTYNSDNNTNFDLGTTGTVADWGRINDVSVAVPQNSTTGITIGAATNIAPNNGTTMVALATDSGLTVINLSRQRIVQYADTADDDYNAVFITKTAKLYGLNEAMAQAEKWINIDQDQVNEIGGSGTPDKVWDQASTPALSKSTPTILAGAPDALEVVERGSLADGGLLSTATVPGSSDLIYVGTNQGLTEIHDHSTPASGWSKFFNTTEQTPLMPGTIKRAHLMGEASGDFTDASFRANTMAPIGGITYGVEGVRGKAVTLNGTSGFFCSDNGGATCAVDTDDNMSTTAWSIQMWFKHVTTQAGNDVLYSKCYNTTPAAAAACVTIYMTSTGTMVAALDDDATWVAYSSYDQMGTSTRTYNDNQWHHVVLARDNANDINFYIDGTPVNLSTATGSTLTVDVSQIVSIGADCSVGAACATGANFWDGSIDDFTFSQGTTTVDAMTSSQARRMYNDARPLINKKVISVTDATTATSTTIGDSGETWIPNEFAGQIMEITGGTGVGQTRRVISNTATILTVSPAFSTTPDTTSDFQLDPEALYGASNNVTAIGITAESPMGEARLLCAGTNSGTDTGGVSCYNHQAGPNVIADVYHGDSEQSDDAGVEWTGTDYDDIQTIDLSGRAFVIGTMAHVYVETQDVRLGQGLDYLANQIFNTQNAVKNLGLQTLAGSSSIEVGFTGGADLAEYYTSLNPLEAGDVVAIDASQSAGIRQSTKAYQKDILGVVATSPALILGTKTDDGYPVALTGRIPVKVTTENGTIKAGDQITSSSTAGYAMKAVKPGRVLGVALEDLKEENLSLCLENSDLKCGTVLMFVNLGNGLGEENSSEVIARSEVTKQSTLDLLIEEIATPSATARNDVLRLPNLSIDGLATVSADLRVKNNTLIEGILTIIGTLNSRDLIVNGLATFFGDVVFKGNVSFSGHPTFGSDTAGIAVVKKDSDRVEVIFEKEYEQMPVVNASISLESRIMNYESREEEMRLEEEFEKSILAGDVRYVVAKRTAKGFMILLNKPATEDITFSWIALSGRGGKNEISN